jgi:hypothetical protein
LPQPTVLVQNHDLYALPASNSSCV